MPTRRRFLTVAATALGAAAFAAGRPARTEWQGKAMGADVSISIDGEGEAAQAALGAARDTIRRMERLFSLYDPASALSQLNRLGELLMPAEFARLVSIADHAHKLTDGLFDPAIQPVFQALARSQPLPDARLIDWRMVQVKGRRISLPEPGMALTFNGIAQGFATDRVSEVLAAHGFHAVLVNVGEYRAGTAKAKIGIADYESKLLQQVELRREAIATSSPMALRLRGSEPHILSPDLSKYEPRWRTVSAVAKTAAIADALSTALALTPDEHLAEQLVGAGVLRRVFLEDSERSVKWIG